MPRPDPDMRLPSTAPQVRDMIRRAVRRQLRAARRVPGARVELAVVVAWYTRADGAKVVGVLAGRGRAPSTALDDTGAAAVKQHVAAAVDDAATAAIATPRGAVAWTAPADCFGPPRDRGE